MHAELLNLTAHIPNGEAILKYRQAGGADRTATNTWRKAATSRSVRNAGKLATEEIAITRRAPPKSERLEQTMSNLTPSRRNQRDPALGAVGGFLEYINILRIAVFWFFRLRVNPKKAVESPDRPIAVFRTLVGPMGRNRQNARLPEYR